MKRPSIRKLNQAGRPTLAELERRKAKVMQIATDLFVGNGYAGTSLVDIARGAGVATRTLYQHFGDKEGLFREVVYARESGSVTSPPTLKAGDTLFSALSAAADYIYAVAFRPRSVDLMRLMIVEGRRFPDMMRAVGLGTWSRFRANVASVFAELAEHGLTPVEEDYQQTGGIFIDLMLGSAPVFLYADWGAQPPETMVKEQKIDLFISGRFGTAVARRARIKQASGRRRTG